jgi:hypothetical protein
MRTTSQLVTSETDAKGNYKNYLTSNKLTSLDIQVRALTIAGDLACTVEPNDMTAWYCKAYKAIGEGKYTMIAGAARKGKKPQSLFGWLLKQEMGKRI